jgi:tyrosine-protein phosphatase YwqE
VASNSSNLLYEIIKDKKKQTIKQIIITFLLAFSLSALGITAIIAKLEKNDVIIQTPKKSKDLVKASKK